MPDWLVQSFETEAYTINQLLVRLIAATVYGGCVAVIYRVSHGRTKEDASVMTTTLVLLSILIAMVSMVIGDSVARAFSLVGALSIVRFRTIVEDTRDTAFVIFAVIVGMAAGAGLMHIALVGIPIVAIVAVLLGLPRRGKAMQRALAPDSKLTVRLGLGRDPEMSLGAVLDRHVESYRLTQVETARQGSALDLHYLVRLRSAAVMAPLVSELNQVEGVQSVDLLA
jgi:uncharacterized membrane protein YhiD involved in acid resistance